MRLINNYYPIYKLLNIQLKLANKVIMPFKKTQI